MTSIDATLGERGTRYGEFTDNAATSQAIKAALHQSIHWYDMAADQREALEMIGHKMARIVNGDANYVDSWHDIIGYARLVEERLTTKADSAKTRKK